MERRSDGSRPDGAESVVGGSHELIQRDWSTEDALRRSQAELRAIYDHAPVMMCVIDEQRQVIYGNRAVSEFTGLSEESLRGDRACGILGCINAKEDPRGCGFGARCETCSLREAIRDTFRTGKSHTGIEYRATLEQHSGRRDVTLLGCTALIRHDSHDLLLLCLQDITDRVQSEERFRILAETMLQGVVHQDEQGVIIAMNPAAERILGKGPADFLGSSSVGEERDTIREDGSPFPGLEHPAMVALRTGQPVRGVVMGVYNPRIDGTRWISVDAVPLVRPGADRPYQVYTVFEDITQRRRAEQEKLEMERRLFYSQKLESLGVLAGGIAHDFNNILAVIVGYADLLKPHLPPSPTTREYLDVINEAARRATDLTRQMLAYSGQGRFVIEAVNLSQVVNDARKMLGLSVSKMATVTYDLDANLSCIEADSSQIQQVVLNLVVNASEALGETSGGIAISTTAVTLSEAECALVGVGGELTAGRYVRLQVVDTGCGMDRETLAKIFDPFFTTKFTGRGLGLAAVQGIVRGHKGGIQVLSAPGQGTTFRVFFPVSGTPTPALLQEPPATSWQGKGTVLVVDDEETVRHMAQRMLEHAGFAVLTACDGEEAVQRYRLHQAEVVCILLDLTMPKLNGEETLRELRKICPDVPVVLSSGYSEARATERFAGLGLAGFVHKPYQLETLLAQFRAAIADRPNRL